MDFTKLLKSRFYEMHSARSRDIIDSAKRTLVKDERPKAPVINLAEYRANKLKK